MALATTVLQAKGKARGRTQLRNGGRAQRKDECIANAHQTAKGAPCQCLGRVLGARAFGPVFQRHKGQRGVLPLTREAEAQHAHHALHFGLFEDETLNLLHDVLRALAGRARWQLHIDQHGALVLVGQEGGRQTHIHDTDHRNDGDINDEVAGSALQNACHPALIVLGCTGETPVKPAKEPGLGMVVPGIHLLEQGGAQSGRQ